MIPRVALLGGLLALVFYVCFGMMPEFVLVPGVAVFLVVLGYAWVDADPNGG